MYLSGGIQFELAILDPQHRIEEDVALGIGIGNAAKLAPSGRWLQRRGSMS